METGIGGFYFEEKTTFIELDSGWTYCVLVFLVLVPSLKTFLCRGSTCWPHQCTLNSRPLYCDMDGARSSGVLWCGKHVVQKHRKGLSFRSVSGRST